MGMHFEELDETTRRYMLREFEAEQSAQPYVPKSLSVDGIARFPDLMRDAIASGNEETLCAALSNPALFNPQESYRTKDGQIRERRVNLNQAAGRLSLTEFNTWYVRGLACRLRDDGESECEVYRGAEPKWAPATCSEHEGKVCSVQDILDGHRACYWPEPGDPESFSIPAGPGCHHTIRRLTP